MPKLKRISGQQLINLLEKRGFKRFRQRGSHVVLKKEKIGCVVPLHKELAVGTLRGILRQAQISPDDFII